MYRFEKKYIVNDLQMELLKHRLTPIMNLDPILNGKSFYKIRSLYFDDYCDTNFKQVINGVSKRIKYRIRFYNFNDKYIVLEKKYKINNMTRKSSCEITKRQVLDIINNRNININKNNPKLLNEFYLMIKTRGYRPKTIVDYDRIPYVYQAGYVRITIDYNLSCSYDFKNFFSNDIVRIPLMDKNQLLLEVKYTNYLPDFIRYSLQLNNLTMTSYSKYGNSRLMLKNYVGGCV